MTNVILLKLVATGTDVVPVAILSVLAGTQKNIPETNRFAPRKFVFAGEFDVLSPNLLVETAGSPTTSIPTFFGRWFICTFVFVTSARSARVAFSRAAWRTCRFLWRLFLVTC